MHRRQAVAEWLRNIASQEDWENISEKNVQQKYDCLLELIGSAKEKFGVHRSNVKTDDKLSCNTKELIRRRTEIRNKIKLSKVDQIELVELRKLIKKKIREDINRFENEVTTEIIESSWSTRKVKKALAKGNALMPGLKDSRGNLIRDREGIVNLATEFYSSLYSGGKELGEQESSQDVSQFALEKITPINTQEVIKAIKNIKANKAPGRMESKERPLKCY